MERDDLDLVTDAVLTASRAFVAIAAQSVADLLEELTLAQYRVLVVLATSGPQNLGSLAQVLELNPSTASRLCTRLVKLGLITREVGQNDRREVQLSTTPKGAELFEEVIARRRAKVEAIVDRLTPAMRAQLVTALQALTEAIGEAPAPPSSPG